MSSQTFNISLPQTLVQEVDEVAKDEYLNRSELIRQVLRLYLDESLPSLSIPNDVVASATDWKKSFASIKPLAKRLSFKAQRRMAWEDKLDALTRR